MYSSNLFGFIVCVLVLIASNCAAQDRGGQRQYGQYDTRSRISSFQCRDDVDVAYCRAVKEKRRCVLHVYQKRCKLTCGVCGRQSQPIFRENAECRDIGTEDFCRSVKPACERRRYGGRHQGVRYALRYCRKTCGLCTRQQTKRQEVTCVDRPICQRLTTFYKIKRCSTLPHKLRKRAMKKCPKLCGLCVTEPEKNEIASAKRHEVVDITDTPRTVIPPKKQNRPPHPPIANSESDQEPRRGVFYIYTKYLSL